MIILFLEYEKLMDNLDDKNLNENNIKLTKNMDNFRSLPVVKKCSAARDENFEVYGSPNRRISHTKEGTLVFIIY